MFHERNIKKPSIMGIPHLWKPSFLVSSKIITAVAHTELLHPPGDARCPAQAQRMALASQRRWPGMRKAMEATRKWSITWLLWSTLLKGNLDKLEDFGVWSYKLSQFQGTILAGNLWFFTVDYGGIKVIFPVAVAQFLDSYYVAGPAYR